MMTTAEAGEISAVIVEIAAIAKIAEIVDIDDELLFDTVGFGFGL